MRPIGSNEFKSLCKELREVASCISTYIVKNSKKTFLKMKEDVGISKPKKHRNKIGMVP